MTPASGSTTRCAGFEVAPPGSRARLALNPPMGGEPGGGSIGVETPDVLAEHARLSAIGGIDLDPEPMRIPGAPLMFMLRDPDGNSVAVVEEPPSSSLTRHPAAPAPTLPTYLRPWVASRP